MRTFKRLSSAGMRGSAMIEAAMILPLVILIIGGMLSLGITMNGRVRERTSGFISEARGTLENDLPRIEALLRARWMNR